MVNVRNKEKGILELMKASHLTDADNIYTVSLYLSDLYINRMIEMKRLPMDKDDFYKDYINFVINEGFDERYHLKKNTITFILNLSLAKQGKTLLIMIRPYGQKVYSYKEVIGLLK